MATVTKKTNGNTLVVRFEGAIEETTQFEQLIGATPAEVEVHTKDVPRINSAAVKNWIRYFKGLQTKGIKLRFAECSPAIVEQLGFIKNFACGGAIESICLPFCCANCRTELLSLYKMDDVRRVGLTIPSVSCTRCGGQAEFDDDPYAYLGFALKAAK